MKARLGLVFLLAGGCSTPDPSAKVAVELPDRASFKPLGTLIARRCGMLDCHGTPFKNLRIYGFGGQRLPGADPGHAYPSYGEPLPTDAEIEANYVAVVGLEPEIMAAVVRDRGARPERLTLVRKARGAEDHDGKVVFAPGSDADRCLVTWLAAGIDLAACAAALDDDPRIGCDRPTPDPALRCNDAGP